MERSQKSVVNNELLKSMNQSLANGWKQLPLSGPKMSLIGIEICIRDFSSIPLNMKTPRVLQVTFQK
jgi:hypothetical protein